MMKDQVLSIEQMRHLQKLGIDVSNTNVYWVRRCHGCDIRDEHKGEWFLSLQKDFVIAGFTSYEVIPTFTLQDILEMMPQYVGNAFMYIDMSEKKKRIYYEEENAYGCSMTDIEYNTICEFEGRLLDSAYRMLCWLAENNLLGKK